MNQELLLLRTGCCRAYKPLSNQNLDTSFKEGICYTYELKVGKNKMELTPTSIEDLSGWDSEEELKSK